MQNVAGSSDMYLCWTSSHSTIYFESIRLSWEQSFCTAELHWKHFMAIASLIKRESTKITRDNFEFTSIVLDCSLATENSHKAVASVLLYQNFWLSFVSLIVAWLSQINVYDSHSVKSLLSVNNWKRQSTNQQQLFYYFVFIESLTENFRDLFLIFF